ncbi:hypothetical protein DFH06DRAFT_1108069 [Mycena polygramma]|nr:hypothetical protein DFH06DRAFT_1108069 [Mycena polygramma]
MDILRLERNNKREERRKAGEQDVSDDEEDELTAFLVVAPSGENPQPQGETGTPPSPKLADALPNSQLLFDDAVAAKNSFHAHDDSIPTAIFSLAKNGISPPLTLFLPTSLERIRASNVKTVKHGTGDTAKVTVIDVADFPTEDSLDQATWQTSYNTFLSFMEIAVGPLTFQGFAQHYNRILTDPALKLWFLAYRIFDQTIRAQFFTKPYIIDINDVEYRTALQSAKDTYLLSSHPVAQTPSGSPRGPSGKERVERFKPYDRENSHKKPILCFRCGRVGHGALACSEVNQSKHGREFVIFANHDGLFRISDKRSVCFAFNLRGCNISGGSHAIHICTLCGNPRHGATDCTRN